jgi:hypothetical protein
MIVNGLEIEMMQSGGLCLLMTHSLVYYSCYLQQTGHHSGIAVASNGHYGDENFKMALESLEQAELAPTLHRDESAESFFDT